MSLTLYNTLTRRKEAFVPIDPANVRMYACGPTVYDRVHIGNGRMFVVFDLLFRLLRQIYGDAHVTYARNITDVDDKINARAAEAKIPIGELTARTTCYFHEDVAGLACLPPTIEPRATEHIEEMKALCERLVASGHAYVASDHVLFHVPSMLDYGRLSNRSVEDMQAGARVDVAPYKKDPMDFVLWKPSPPGIPAWPSPCGIAVSGRPGWHIECSAMAGKHLGEVFDIHGGGIDLVFPHHENELAQSRCAHGTPVLANVWMHNGFLEAAEGEKMSKSLGNFITVHELLQRAPGEAGRMALLASHYRQPLPWSERGVLEARRTLDQWYEVTADAADAAPLSTDMCDALQDDLNTPAAFAALHALRSEAVKGDQAAAACLKSSARFMGFLQQSPAQWKAWRPADVEIDDARVEALIAARRAARTRKDFAESDRIRDELSSMGVVLKDGKDPTTGEMVTTWELKR